jgi:hypothetical protein
MTKPQAAGLLGGLTLVAVLLLSTLGGATENVFTRDFLHAVEKACVDDAADVVACLTLVDTVEGFVQGEEAGESFLSALERGLLKGKFWKGTNHTECEECITRVQDLEMVWAKNQSEPGDVLNVFRAACSEHFEDPADQTECIAAVGSVVAPVMDLVLAEQPPLLACRALSHCPPE